MSGMLAALGIVAFRRFWTSVALMALGFWMQAFAFGYFTVQLAVREGAPERGSLYLGFVGLAQAIPALTLGLFGGVLADRVDRRRLLVVSQSLLVTVSVVAMVLMLTGRVGLVAVLALSVAFASISGLSMPARQALVPALVPRERLISAVGLNSAAYYSTQFIGPLLAGVLFVPLGIGGIFAVIAGLQLASLLALLVALPLVPARAASPSQVGVFRSLQEGLAYTWRDPIVRWIFVLFAGSSLLIRPYLSLLPAVSEQVLNVGAVELSWLLGASGGGAFAGTIATAALTKVERRGRLLMACAGLAGLLVAAFALQRALVGALALIVLLGFTIMLFVGMTNTILQIRTPEALRGRVMSLALLSANAVMPTGLLALGALGSVVGVDVALAVGAALFLGLVGVSAWRGGSLWRASIHPGLSRAEVVAAVAD